MNEGVSRRAFLLGATGALVVAYSPLDRFCDWLERVWGAVFKATKQELTSFSDVLKRLYPQEPIFVAMYTNRPVWSMMMAT